MANKCGVGGAYVTAVAFAGEPVALTSPVEAATEKGLKAGVPELRRAAARLAELLEGTVY